MDGLVRQAYVSQPNTATGASEFNNGLMTPADFRTAKAKNHVAKELYSPTDFDSSYDCHKSSSADQGFPYVAIDKWLPLPPCDRDMTSAALGNKRMVISGSDQKLTSTGGRENTSETLKLIDSKTCAKSEQFDSPRFNDDTVFPAKTELICRYLLDAAVNLSAVTCALIKKNTCRCRKKQFDRLKHHFNHHCTHLHAIHTKKAPGAVMSEEASDDSSLKSSKEPTPDIFNQWPNIPLPPHPEGEDVCQSTCCGRLNCNGDVGVPLAAALFHNDDPECCVDSVVEDPSVPSTYPIGVFWDIENCAVPTGKSAQAIVQRVRDKFFAGHKEAEFMCVCDIIKENRNVVEELNKAQVDVVHVNATAKNAADDKLRQSIRRFAHNHPAPATLVLITGDTNFTSEVSDLRHRHKYFVVLIHPTHASWSLKQAANTVICYEEFVSDLPLVHGPSKSGSESNQSLLLVSNLPLHKDANAIRLRLHQLTENCGGKVLKLSMGTAILKFSSPDVANRAMKRIDGDNVFGRLIKVSVLKQSPLRNFRNFSPARNTVSKRSKAVTNGFYGQPTVHPPFMKMAPAPIAGRPQFPAIGNFSPMYQQLYPPAPPLPSFHPMHPTFHRPSGYFAPSQPVNDFRNAVGGILPPTHPPLIFQPPPASNEQCFKENASVGIKLTVSNIDSQLGINAIRDILMTEVSSYCRVLDMKVRPHNRFTVVCDVTVPHLQDASNVLQKLQRQKIGTKRVLVTLAQQNAGEMSGEEAAALKKDCFTILSEAVDRKMPLYEFLNTYETRFHRKIGIEELRQIQDVAVLRDQPVGQEISLSANIRDRSALEHHLSSCTRSGRSSPDINHAFLLPVCKAHFPADSMSEPSRSNRSKLLKIDMGLREFSAKLHALLHSHNGILQLDGFEFCYCAEFGAFPFPNNPDEGGVIVEHQASYVPGVQIITSQPHCLGVKAIVWAQPQSDIGSDSASDASGASRWKSPNLIHFSREVVELLKGRPYCCLPYDNFASAYQIYFGHPCRPSEYGFTRLSDLLSAIPHVLQIIGSLSDRVVTLTHRAQVKRFTQEVVKILKTTPDRAILVAQMPELYNRTFNRVWRMRDYGVSVLPDLLDDIPEGHICTTGEGDNIVLSLPSRERTAEEKERTCLFAKEVIKILRERPQYRMPFTEFVPAYHRQFGRQCKLSNYGFSKLIDLFEALPLYVQVIEKGTEKYIALTEIEHQKILSMQISALLRAQIPPSLPLMHLQSSEDVSYGPSLPLSCVPALFQQKYRFSLLPEDLGCHDLEELMKKLSHAVQVYINDVGDRMIRLAKKKPLRKLAGQLLTLILDCKSDHLDVDQLCAMYFDRYKEGLRPSEYGFMAMSDIIRKILPHVVKMDLDAPECVIHVKPLYIEARAIRSILLQNNGTMTLGEFNFAYLTTFHCPVDCEKLGFPSLEALLRALGYVFLVKGFGSKRTLTLRNRMHVVPGLTKKDDCRNSLLGSASLDDLQDLNASRSQFTSWRPKVPPCMMPFWNDLEQKKSLTSSASMDNFRTGQSHGNLLSSKKGLIPTMRQSSGNAKSNNPREKALSSKLTGYDYSPKSACNFTVGGGDLMSAHSPGKGTVVQPRNFSYSVITLPNGSTPIASTPSCSSASSSLKSSADASSDAYSSDTDSLSESSRSVGRDRHILRMSSLPCSPFTRMNGEARAGSLQMLQNPHLSSDGGGSPQRIQLAASFPTLTHS